MRCAFKCERDNLAIRGYVYKTKKGRLPALILCHGYLGNHRNVRGYATAAAKAGFAAFTFDFNGGGPLSSSSGKSLDMTVMTEVNDLISVIEYIKTRDDVDAERIMLLGCSQGGLVSALTAKRLQREIKGLIMLYPALCIPDDARRGNMIFARFDPKNIPDVIQQQPMPLGGCYPRCVIDWDVYEEISGYSGPVLLMHGTADRIVDISYGRRAKEVYADIEYREFEGADHGFGGNDEAEARKSIKDFILRHS